MRAGKLRMPAPLGAGAAGQQAQSSPSREAPAPQRRQAWGSSAQPVGISLLFAALSAAASWLLTCRPYLRSNPVRRRRAAPALSRRPEHAGAGTPPTARALDPLVCAHREQPRRAAQPGRLSTWTVTLPTSATSRNIMRLPRADQGWEMFQPPLYYAAGRRAAERCSRFRPRRMAG